MNKYSLLLKFSLLLLILIAPKFKVSAQTNIHDKQFGFNLSVPAEWNEYGRSVYDKRRILSEYAFQGSLPDSVERTSEWQSSLDYTAIANGEIHSLEEFKNQQKDQLKKRFPGLVFIEENDSTLFVHGAVHDMKLAFYYCFNFVNGIGYKSSYSTSRELFTDLHKTALIEIFQSIDFFRPEVDYTELDQLITESPDDATLHYQKAELAWTFHDYEVGLTECDAALDCFPFYGEAFYRRGLIHLMFGDTVSACNDFNRAIEEDFKWDLDFMEIREFCKDVSRVPQEENFFSDFDVNTNHAEFIDSVSKHDSMILGFSGEPKAKVLNYMGHVNHMFQLDFYQLNEAFDSGNDIIKLYCFGIIAKKYHDSLNKNHRKLMKSKNSVEVMNDSQVGTTTKEVSSIAKKFYERVSFQKEEVKVQVKIQKEVEKFIKKYALYPSSYEKLEFGKVYTLKTYDPKYKVTEKNSETYTVSLVYKLKNKEGKSIESDHIFKFNYKFMMNIIEEEEGNTIFSDPPKIEEWLELYARELSVKERKKLGLN